MNDSQYEEEEDLSPTYIQNTVFIIEGMINNAKAIKHKRVNLELHITTLNQVKLITKALREMNYSVSHYTYPSNFMVIKW